jgi:hypothetical protein
MVFEITILNSLSVAVSDIGKVVNFSKNSIVFI